MTLPFTFAWVDETQTTFNASTMGVLDEDVYSLEIKHDEGQVPTLDIVIRNPRIGLLNPGRKVWTWLAWDRGDGVLVPLFFGVLVGVPTSLFKEKVTLQFIARSPQFIANKQAFAETMKHRPYWDPAALDISHRDDPDAILEGWSALWHIDRTTLAVTASDILVGEDGNVQFLEEDILYDSVSLSLGQPPLTNIRVEATVNWTQRSSGYIAVPSVNVSSYTGDSFMSGWPKPGASIGGGYKVQSSFINDTYLVSQTPTTSYSSSWTNTDPNPGQCSNASASNTSSGPALLSPNPLSCTLTTSLQSGLCFPDSDPPQNLPMQLSASGIIVPLMNFSADMTLRYDSQRQYSEVLAFDMVANTQGILASPTVAQETELLTLSLADVGAPLIEVDAWSDFANKPVGIAQIVFPNNPTTPGGLAYQICVGPGTAGAVEPVFSDIIGTITNDNGVLWASMGLSPLTTAANWSPASYVPVGQIISFTDTVFNPADGEFENIPNRTTYYLCTVGGETNSAYEVFSYTPPITSNVQVPPAQRIISRIAPPAFSTTPGAIIADGSVRWTVLGQSPAILGIPIGGTPDNVTARSYFPTARGLWSVEYLICRARARLRMRARAVKVGWTCPFELAVGLSCRKNATMFDPRVPGGAATGKITSYTLSASGDGTLRGHVEIGCSIGFGESVPQITGTPVYASPGYMQVGYQRYEGRTVVLGSNDTSYTLPADQGFDDGLVFPLRWQDISDGGRISGTLAEQADAITKSFAAAIHLQFINNFGGSISSRNGNIDITGVPPDTAWELEREALALTTTNTPYVMQAHPISWSVLLKPCSGNGPFGGAYAISVSPLSCPQGINLEAPSTP